MSKLNGKILLVDDDKDVLFTAQLVLKQKFKEVKTETNPKRLLNLVREFEPDVIFLDMNFVQGATSGNEGLFWLQELLKSSPGEHVVLNTAYGDIQLAVEAMKLGAIDFLVKPWEKEKLLTTAINVYNLKRSKKEIKALKDKQKELNQVQQTADSPIVYRSASMKQVMSTVAKVAQTDASVLILGENGTGKELVARELHQQSSRAHQPFIKVDLGALAENLFESELFGHIKGAFTDAKQDKKGKFEIADGGTIFLDEIGNIQPDQQIKLLSVLQNMEVNPLGAEIGTTIDVRVICATNANLDEFVGNGQFREDLYFRINTIAIELPGLKERHEDIELIAHHYLDLFKKKYHKPETTLSDDALQSLNQYNWPGNIRELQHTIERAVILSDGSAIETTDLMLKAPRIDIAQPKQIGDWEQSAIQRAVQEHDGNLSKAAASLGMGRTTLYRKIKKYNLDL